MGDDESNMEKNSKLTEGRWGQQIISVSNIQLTSKMCKQNHPASYNIHEQ